MSKRGIVMGSAVVVLVGAVLAGQALSGEGRGRRRWDPARMRRRMQQRMKEQLGATDEQWETLGPQIEKVQTLTTQIKGGGMIALMRRRALTAQAGEGEEQTELEKATQELQAALADEATEPAQIKKLLAALRDAREKGKEELAKEQDALRKLVNVRQEAQLVLMGLLD